MPPWSWRCPGTRNARFGRIGRMAPRRPSSGQRSGCSRSARRRKAARGRFLMVGTLEPRRTTPSFWTHGIFWPTHSGGAIPRLDILGQPGWCGEEIVARSAPIRVSSARRSSSTPPRPMMRSAPPIPRPIRCSIPSLAEGFGLPPHEALAHGLLPICADLARHSGRVWARMPFTLTQGTSILGGNDKKTDFGQTGRTKGKRSAKRPGWQDHFERVAAALAELRD
jgi:hypothetical protein